MVFYFVRCALLANHKYQVQCIRHYRLRGKPPGVARTLKERLDELNYKDELYTTSIDIGLPHLKPKKSTVVAERMKHIVEQKKDSNLANLARKHELLVNLDTVKEDWLKVDGPGHIKRISQHYGIYEHLYGEGFFYPRIPMTVHFEQEDGSVCPVYYGNVVKPSEASVAPLVSFSSDDKSLWSLVLTNLDGHLTDNDKEYVHWFVANIPGNKIENGQTLVNYLQPIPLRGTGYHRYVFVLYKQTKTLKFSIPPGESLNDRTFHTRDWYSKHQDDITPAGLAFFQSDWDQSLKDFYHNVLNISEPVFEYDFPKPYIKPQEWFPLREPFNEYMDRYRDPKQINKEYLERVLKTEHPFKSPPPPLKYPNAQPFPKDKPSWLRTQEEKMRLGRGRINNIE